MSRVSRQRLQRRWIFRGIYALYAIGVIAGGLWLYGWMLMPSAPDSLGETGIIWTHYYPELKQSAVLDVKNAPDGELKVLLLGASVLEEAAPYLESRLQQEFGNRVRIYNLAVAAHTTRDSVLKYQLLDPADFDLVIVYHGINDARMNYCPRDEFRADYTHISWYRGIRDRLESGSMTVPDILEDRLRHAFTRGRPDPKEWPNGADIKTRKPFHDHIEEILSRSTAAGTPILLMSFAWWLPDDFSQTAGYGTGKTQLSPEVWGDPQYLPQILNAHNEIIRDLSERPDVQFVDQEHLLPHDGETFCDPCHLTQAGYLRFVENLWPAVKQTLDAAQ